MSNYTGRGNNAGPASDFFPLSGSTASSPVILITATVGGAGTTIHTADQFAQDVPIIYVANVGGVASAVAYLQMGSTSTTLSIPLAIATSSYNLIQPGTPISKLGVVGIWSTQISGTFAAYGGVTRTYTATA